MVTTQSIEEPKPGRATREQSLYKSRTTNLLPEKPSKKPRQTARPDGDCHRSSETYFPELLPDRGVRNGNIIRISPYLHGCHGFVA
jgi:hypothetical protein